MAPASSPIRPLGAWGLVWLAGAAAAVWIPLLVADSLPRGSTARSPAYLVAPAAKHSAGLKHPPPPTAPKVANVAKTHAPLWAGQITPLAAKRVKIPMAKARPKTTPIPRLVRAVALAPAPALAQKPANASAAARQHSLPGSLLLGGPLTLASLQEKTMVPAARLEQVLGSRSGDRLSTLPRPWQTIMAALLQGNAQVLPLEVVRLPVPHLQAPEQYPMAVRDDGVASTPVTPSELSRQALARWAQRQRPTPKGSVRPVMVVLEPLAAEPGPNGRATDP
jgi:hypothetical protein